MKYVLAFSGAVIGQVVGSFIADSRVVDWTLAAILMIIGYQLPAFIRYTRSTPKQLLAFHGPGAPISRSKSSGELRAFLSQLRDGGLLLDFHPNNDFAKVDQLQWASLGEPEKLVFAEVLMQAQSVDGTSAGEIKLLDRDGTLLGSYSTADRTARTRETEN